MEQGRQALARELKGAREHCRRTLSVAPFSPTHAAAPGDAPRGGGGDFKLSSAQRHEEYWQRFAAKVEEERKREEALHLLSCGGGSPLGAAQLQLATQGRAESHAQRSAERRRHEATRRSGWPSW